MESQHHWLKRGHLRPPHSRVICEDKRGPMSATKNQGVGGRSRPERPPPFRVRTISICDLQAQHLGLRSAIVSGVCEVVPKLQIRNPKRVQGQVAAGGLWVSLNSNSLESPFGKGGLGGFGARGLKPSMETVPMGFACLSTRPVILDSRLRGNDRRRCSPPEADRESESVPQILSLCCPPRLGDQGVERDCLTNTIAIPIASCTGTARRAPTIACRRVFRDDLHPRAGMPPRPGC
jgi:hypothetical protein